MAAGVLADNLGALYVWRIRTTRDAPNAHNNNVRRVCHAMHTCICMCVGVKCLLACSSAANLVGLRPAHESHEELSLLRVCTRISVCRRNIFTIADLHVQHGDVVVADADAARIISLELCFVGRLPKRVLSFVNELTERGRVV